MDFFSVAMATLIVLRGHGCFLFDREARLRVRRRGCFKFQAATS